MRYYLLLIFTIASFSSFNNSCFANTTGTKKYQKGPTYVKGHVTKRGKYVKPHYKSSPNEIKQDNLSSKGRINPYTGKKGTINPSKVKTNKREHRESE